jgi:hypothetical protein
VDQSNFQFLRICPDQKIIGKNKKAVILCICIGGLVAATEELQASGEEGQRSRGLVYFSYLHL